MAFLIHVFVDGSRVGWCNQECYNSKSPTCRCCCGGQNHGLGLRKARAITKKMPLAQIAAWAERHFTIRHSLMIAIRPPHARLMPCVEHESDPHGAQEAVE